jgi:N6-L-threonylcarbamoyladenine synthase
LSELLEKLIECKGNSLPRKMILGIESSCDESALAIFDPVLGIQGEWLHSQINRHAEYGGVVPDLAVREHLQNFFPLLDQMRQVHCLPGKISKIAVTCGPGLIGCLGVGLGIAKTLGELWQLPVHGVNHLRAHAFSPFMRLPLNEFIWSDWLPHLGLLVSGGNTLLFEISSEKVIRVIGRTRDDAVGEALDKGAKLLGIPYPGGAELERQAETGNSRAFSFPRSIESKAKDDFSFSGLKTSLLYTLQKMNPTEIENRHTDLCASYQEAAVDQLTRKCSNFLDGRNYRSFGLSGGVANNLLLRQRMEQLCLDKKLKFLPVERQYSGDNAAMIAHAAYLDPDGLWPNDDGQLNFSPGLTLDELP